MEFLKTGRDGRTETSESHFNLKLKVGSNFFSGETSSCLFFAFVNFSALVTFTVLSTQIRPEQFFGRKLRRNPSIYIRSSNVKSECVDGKRIPLKKIKWMKPNLAIRFGQSASTKSIRGKKL